LNLPDIELDFADQVAERGTERERERLRGHRERDDIPELRETKYRGRSTTHEMASKRGKAKLFQCLEP
jgi:hypothetical protein